MLLAARVCAITMALAEVSATAAASTTAAKVIDRNNMDAMGARNNMDAMGA